MRRTTRYLAPLVTAAALVLVGLSTGFRLGSTADDLQARDRGEAILVPALIALALGAAALLRPLPQLPRAVLAVLGLAFVLWSLWSVLTA